jgi:hypothetical protein
MTVYSTTAGTKWNLSAAGSRTVSYLTVKDSNQTNATIACSTGCSDGGNNVGWDFTAAAASSSSTSSTSGGGGGGGGGSPHGFITPSLAGSASSASSQGAANSSSSVGPNGASGFHDVPAAAWFGKYVSFIVSRGIASGYKDAKGKLTGKYGPANNVTFGEMVKMALGAGNHDVSHVTGSPMNLSARGDWSQAYVKLAENLQFSVITRSLKVTEPASRGAVVLTLLQSLGIPVTGGSNPFTDLSSSNTYAKALETALRLGWISGDTDASGKILHTVRPNDPINRAEVAKIFAKALGFSQ